MNIEAPAARGAALLVPLLAAIALGLYPSAAKIAYRDGATPAFVIIVTTFFRAAALILFCVAKRTPWLPTSAEWKTALSGGFFQAASIFGIIASLEYLPGPVTITIVFCSTIMLLLFLAVRGEQSLTVWSLVTTVVALFGISLVLDVWSNIDHLPWRGLVLASIAAIATTTRLYVFGKQVKTQDPAALGAQVFSMTFLFTLLLVIFMPFGAPQSFSGYAGTAACSLSLVLGTFGMFYGIALCGAFRFSLLLKLEPAFTAVFSAVLLDEVLRGTQYAGMFLVLISLATFQLADRYSKPSK